MIFYKYFFYTYCPVVLQKVNLSTYSELPEFAILRYQIRGY